MTMSKVISDDSHDTDDNIEELYNNHAEIYLDMLVKNGVPRIGESSLLNKVFYEQLPAHLLSSAKLFTKRVLFSVRNGETPQWIAAYNLDESYKKILQKASEKPSHTEEDFKHLENLVAAKEKTIDELNQQMSLVRRDNESMKQKLQFCEDSFGQLKFHADNIQELIESDRSHKHVGNPQAIQDVIDALSKSAKSSTTSEDSTESANSKSSLSTISEENDINE